VSEDGPPPLGSDPENRARAWSSWRADWDSTSRRLRLLQIAQLGTLIALGIGMLAITVFAGLRVLALTDDQARREQNQQRLVALQTGMLENQATALRDALARGDTRVPPAVHADLVRFSDDIGEVIDTAERLSRDSDERAARFQFAGALSALGPYVGPGTTPADGERLISDRGQAALGNLNASLQRWSSANAETVARSRDRTQVLILRTGAVLTLIVATLLLAGIGLWWLLQRSRHGLERALRRIARRYRSLAQNSSDLVMVLSAHGLIEYVSESASRVLGMSPEELVGLPLPHLLHAEDSPRVMRVLSGAEGTDLEAPIDLRLLRRDGSWVNAETLIVDMTDDAAIQGWVLNSRDVTDRKAVEAELQRQAFHDPLTGLANRALFEDRLDHALRLHRAHGSPVGVFMLDLDDFKTVNDSLGHHVGDELLIEIAGRVADSIRPEDTAARLGGDEFAVLVESVEGPDSVETILAIAARLSQAVRRPQTVADRQVTVGASVGVAIADGPDAEPETLLRQADIAMYEAKRSNAPVALFAPEMQATVERRLDLTIALTRSVEEGTDLELDYQPIVALETGTIVGMEALLRWNHPVEGRLMPEDFIGLAEETGLIMPIGRWVLQQACAQGAAWNRDLGLGHPIGMSVNVSARQLEEASLVDDVRAALEVSGFEPEQLTLEVTESALMRDLDEAVERLKRLKDLGTRVAIDDFGTGYASLAQLGRLPVDLVKIDKTFVDGVGGRHGNAELAATIVKLGAVLNLGTIAEGIEFGEQVQGLQELRCELGQGFYFARPLSVEAAGDLLRTERHAGRSVGERSHS
jgi:diguanylate cyclase (GGDEF)-like protein/PAS domain S-box-containing protein